MSCPIGVTHVPPLAREVSPQWGQVPPQLLLPPMGLKVQHPWHQTQESLSAFLFSWTLTIGQYHFIFQGSQPVPLHSGPWGPTDMVEKHRLPDGGHGGHFCRPESYRGHAWPPQPSFRYLLVVLFLFPSCFSISLLWISVFNTHSPEAFVYWENSSWQQRSPWPVLTRRIQMCLLAVGPAKKDQVLLLINPWKDSNVSSFRGKQLPSRLHQENKAGGLVTDSRSWHFPED